MRLLVFHGKTYQTASLADLPALLDAPTGTIWLDMVGTEPEALRLMRDVFRFHPLSIEDTQNQRQRPKLEEYHHHWFAILNSAVMEEGDLDYYEIDVFIGKNFFVTVHEEGDPLMEAVHRYVCAPDSALPEVTPMLLMYALADRVVDNFFPIVDEFSETIDALEERLIRRPTSDALTRIFTLKRNLMELWRITSQQRDMLNAVLHRDVVIQNSTLQFYYRDIYDHLLRVIDLISTYRDITAGLMDLYLSATSNRLNRVVNRLAVITIVIGLFTVLSGFYGMNFEQTWPPFKEPLGAPFVLGLMFLSAIAALGVMRWQKLY
jgi:magnesium transporter